MSQMPPIQGFYHWDIASFSDLRGAFHTYWNTQISEALGFSFQPSESNVSVNSSQNTLRGMHFQSAPYQQAKIVSCIRGKAYDVVLDIRRDSPSFGLWSASVLDSTRPTAQYIPKGCAHGFVTLEKNTEIFYLIEGEYQSSHASVIRWDDPFFNIEWPVSAPILSDKDRNAPDFEHE